MFQRKRRSQIPLETPGECRHLYLTREPVCVHCGMKFELAWTAERGPLTFSLKRNAASAIIAAACMAGFYLLDLRVPAYAFLVAAVFFTTRSLLGGLEMFQRHGFVPGKLGELSKAASLNFLLPKPYLARVGIVRFPMDKAAYEQFQPGDTLLVEHLRWSRLPVAIYRGRMP